MHIIFDCFLALSLITSTLAQNTHLVTVEKPVSNQQLSPGQSVIIEHTIVGVPYSASSQILPNYPSSIDLILRWEEKNNSQVFHQLTARTGLDTDPYPGGLKNQNYTQQWRLPNHRFFNRYKPTEWSFTLIFQPVYKANNVSSIPLYPHTLNVPVKTLGPQQENIILPLSIQPSNNTVSPGKRHKKNQ